MAVKADLQRILECSPAVHYFAEASRSAATLWISEGARRFGYPIDRFVRDPDFWQTLIHPDDCQRVLAARAAVLESGRHVDEYRFRAADGSWRWIRDERVLVRDEDGNGSKIAGSWLDLTALKEAEEACGKAVNRLKESQRLAGIGSWEVDTLTSKQWWSDETYRILGEDPNTYEASAAHLLSKIHPDDRQRFSDSVQRARADGKPYSLDYRIVLPDGTEKVIHGRGYGVVKKSGSAMHFAGTVQDITERERTEQALREAEARNRALLEANPDVIIRVDAEGRYLDLSVASTTKFPFTHAEILGRNVKDLYGDEFAEEHQRHVRKAIETGETQLWECRMTVAGHGEVDLEARFVRSGEDEAVVTIRDVTERVALQREIVAAQERERSRIGRDLHDGLGQELTGISLGLEALAQKLAAERSPHAQTVQNLKALTQKSISAARRIALSLSPVFGSELRLGEALELLANEISENSSVRCSARCPRDAHQHDIEVEMNLYRIAQESVANALKHGRPGHIDLRFGCNGRVIRLEVLDDGAGIPPEPQRVEGMGLRSMRYRAQLLNGSFEISERKTDGTRVVCSCPCQR